MSFDPSTQVDGTENFYNVDDLKTRVRVLEAADCGQAILDEDSDYCGNENCPTCETGEELAGLRELLDDAYLGLHYQTLYRDSYMAEYAEDYAKDIAGREAVDMLDSYVDWDHFGSDLADDMVEYKIFGHTYHAR
jgi:hypothetical protein